jgi:hypothetical protein
MSVSGTQYLRRALMAGALAALTGCGRDTAVTLGDAEVLGGSSSVGTAPMFAVSSAGREALAWVSAPDGGTDGRLRISVGGGAPVELRDTLGPIVAHGEAPPKLAYGPDGSLVALYNVGKVVPGQRWPLDALRLVRSADGGSSWSAPVTVTGGADFGSHNFHSLYVAPDGTIYISWLDGSTGKSAAYVTASTDGGKTWTHPGRVSTGEACPCCRTSIVADKKGTAYIAWREVLPGSIRDIVVARSSDRGATWTPPVRVHADDWKFDGCPHAGPALQVDPQRRLHVAWWTGAERKAGVYYARSADGGQTFDSAVALRTANFSRPSHAQLALDGDSLVVVAWEDGTAAVPQVVMRVSRDGGRTFGAAQRVSTSERAAGFPVLALSRRGVTIAWSEQSPEQAVRAEHEMMAMERDTTAVMGLHAVGAAQVVVRRGRIE